MTDTAEPTPQERFNNAIEGLRHLPATGAVTFRGVTSPRGQTPEVLVTQNITATSRDLSVASIGLTSPGIAVVVARTGRDLDPISAVPAAQEVALLPGTVLYIGRFIHAAGHDVELIEPPMARKTSGPPTSPHRRSPNSPAPSAPSSPTRRDAPVPSTPTTVSASPLRWSDRPLARYAAARATRGESQPSPRRRRRSSGRAFMASTTSSPLPSAAGATAVSRSGMMP